MKKNKKIILMISGVILLSLVALCVWYFLLREIDYNPPITSLKQENLSISKSNLREIDYNFSKALEDKRLENEKIVYDEGTYHLQNNQYIGRFSGGNTFTYQFTIDLDTSKVKIIEFAKRYLPLEYQEQHENDYVDGYQ